MLVSAISRALVLPLAIVVAVTIHHELGAQTGKKDAGPPGAVKPQAHGKETPYKLADLKRFDKPITTPGSHRPPEKKGGDWRWHPNHGWVFLTGAAIPVEVVLPAAYVLPAQVVVYEVEAAFVSVVCPHCGKPFVVHR